MTTSTHPEGALAGAELYPAVRAKIAVGIGTWTGIISAGATALVPFIAWAGDLGLGAPETWAGISAALAGLTMLGRYGQAIAAILKSDQGDVVTIPPDMGDGDANVGPDGAPLV